MLPELQVCWLLPKYGVRLVKNQHLILFSQHGLRKKRDYWVAVILRNIQKLIRIISRLIVNLDMISRSSADDSAHLQLSVGTLKGSEVFKAIAQSNNLLLSHPFKLDLWEASKMVAAIMPLLHHGISL